MPRPCSPFFGGLLLVLVLHPLKARDAYGNATPWTNSDNTIRAIQSQRAQAERPRQWWESFSSGPSPASYQTQQEIRRRQQADAARERAENAAWETYERERPRIAPQPLTYEEHLVRRVRNHSDRAAQQELAFYYLGVNKPLLAVPHLEMIAFLKKSDRAGEAAFALFRIASPKGVQPDPQRAQKYLREAVALDHPEGHFTQARGWIFGDDKNGIAPDLTKGLELMEKLLHSDASWYNGRAGQILFKEYLLGIKGPANPTKAIAVTRHMRTITTRSIENWQEDAMVDLLIASPGGWAEHHTEILAAIESNFSALLNPDKAERLVRIYLGLDPETTAHVPVNLMKAAEALSGLARQVPAKGKAYLPVLLAPGPRHSAQAAFSVLEVLREKHPDEVIWIQTTAELLANAYGDSVPADLLTNYLQRLEKTAETPAQKLAVGEFFLVGAKGVPADPVRANRLIDLAVTGLRERIAKYSDNAPETYALARLHVLGLGVPRDIPAAITLLKSHGSSDEPPALLYPHRVLLSSIYFAGYGVERQPRVARSLLNYPARKGYRPAQAAYAEMLATWEDPSELDDGDREQAYRYAKAAADEGNTSARLTLAHFYHVGFGTQADPDLALKIYEDGVSAAVPGALVGLAQLRLDEANPTFNHAAGFDAAQRAAAGGDVEGGYLFGQCLQEGQGTAPDVQRALDVFLQASQTGHWGATVAAARLLVEGRPPIVRDIARAVTVLETAAVRATNQQQFHLVQLLLGDAFLPEDKERARRWNRIAADNGSEAAAWLYRPGEVFAAPVENPASL